MIAARSIPAFSIRTATPSIACLNRWVSIHGTKRNDPMKVGKKKLKMSSGEVRSFRSEKTRDDFERVAKAVKHGFKPTGKKGSKKK
jgi:hypothetical protein